MAHDGAVTLPYRGLSGALILANVALLGGIGALALDGQLSGAPSPLPPALSGPGGATASDPHDHLPLAGMPGATGSPADACARLEGFLINLNEALLRLGQPAPLPLAQIQALGAAGACAVGDPPVRAALDRYAEALRAAGQPLYPPLSSPPSAHRSLKVRPR